MIKNPTSSEIKFKNLLNFRDIGGIVADGDKMIRDGIIFRSANPDSLNGEDIEKLHLLHIRTIIDLRAPGERNKNRRIIENIDVLSLPLDFQKRTTELLKPFLRKKNSEALISDISNSLYLEILDATRDVFRQIIEVLLIPERCPVLIHCQVGKDRTGIICALILNALGVERQLIVDDFMKSNEALRPSFNKMLLSIEYDNHLI